MHKRKTEMSSLLLQMFAISIVQFEKDPKYLPLTWYLTLNVVKSAFEKNLHEAWNIIS